jgi:hypothetical protein
MVVGCIIVVSSGAELSFVHLWMVGADAGAGRHPKGGMGVESCGERKEQADDVGLAQVLYGTS